MTLVSIVLSIQALLGAFDNLWHHELGARLPQRGSARRELTLHAAREAIYAVVFIGLAWFEWRGGFALLLGALLAAELAITLADFLEEDRTRRLPSLERVLHTLLTIGYGVFLGVFVPVLVDWWRLPPALAFEPHGAFSWLLTLYGIGVAVWSLRNALAVMTMGRPSGVVASPTEAAAPRSPDAPASTALVTGATGFVGSALVERLQAEGWRVLVLSRDRLQARALFGARVQVVEKLDEVLAETRIDAIVHLAGARVLGLPWTARRRRELLASRIDVTRAVIELVARLHRRPSVLVSASAVGFYGASPQASFEPRVETSPPRPGEFQSDLCRAIEREACRAEAFGMRVVRLRLGVVFGRGGGAYPMLASSARLGLGAVLGSGRQAAPWIHLDDAVGLIRFAIAAERLNGPVNAVAPDTPTQARFAAALAASFGRRVRLWMPDALLRLAAGEMSTLLLDGQNAVPAAALQAGYVFRHPTLEAALADLADGPHAARR